MSQEEEDLIELLEDTLMLLNSIPRKNFMNIDSYSLAAKLEEALKNLQQERAKNEQNTD